MIACRRATMAALALGALAAGRPAAAQVTYEDVGGIRYQVTRQSVPRQIPITETLDQQQTTYRQQVTTDTVQHQQLYTVPVTQYQLVSRVHGRWNPFVTPYYTHHYEPVTTWQQQVATVQIPVNRVSWAPETRTVKTPVTTYRTANQEMLVRTPIGPATGPLPGSGTALAATAPSGASSQPTATLAARPSAPAASAPTSGGTALMSDPPRQATGWQAQPSRY